MNKHLTVWDKQRRGMPPPIARLIWTLDLVKDAKLRAHLIRRIEELMAAL